MTNLMARAWLALGGLAVMMAALLFIPAGTIHYWQGWVYLVVFFAVSAFTTLDLARRDPKLLERRMRGGPTAEKEPTQRVIMWLASLGFISLLIIPALDRRFGWSTVPVWLVVAGNVLVLLGFGFIIRVYRENTYTSATVEVAQGQTVVSTGPYAIVRHPMYASAMLYIVGTPLALGSYVGFVGVALMVPAIVWRLIDEERLLVRDLPGYADYRRRVRYRLLPYLW
jgi:protein-S-isoprenylcysteine O-methyltransferase Ste14